MPLTSNIEPTDGMPQTTKGTLEVPLVTQSATSKTFGEPMLSSLTTGTLSLPVKYVL